MKSYPGMLAVLACFPAAAALAQTPAVLRDLDTMSPTQLSRQDLDALMPHARVQRSIASGSTHIWTNENDGTFIASSDNRTTASRPTTAPGKWHVTDDGRYCVLIEWRYNPTEEWCRYVLKTTDGHYLTRSTKEPTGKVYKFEFSK